MYQTPVEVLGDESAESTSGQLEKTKEKTDETSMNGLHEKKLSNGTSYSEKDEAASTV